MGQIEQVCCSDGPAKDLLTINHNQVLGDYHESSWPEDPLIKEKLAHLPHVEGKVSKHQTLPRFYQGNWNEQGQPTGKGILVEPDHFIYFGEFNSVPHGHGRFEFLDSKVIYEGEISQGKAQGQGKIHSVDGSYSFEGLWKDSSPVNGHLKVKSPTDPTKQNILTLNDFPIGETKIAYADGRVYTGNVDRRTLIPDGRGTVNFPDKSNYTGDWEGGQFHGFGVFSWPDGSKYSGEYQYGSKHGNGDMLFSSGKLYKGQWKNGKQCGNGTLFGSKNEIIQKGEWKDGIYLK